MTDEAPLIDPTPTGGDAQYNYYGQQVQPVAPSAPSAPLGVSDPQYSYYGSQQAQQQPVEPALVISTHSNNIPNSNPPPVVPAYSTDLGPYSFENASNPKPSAPPSPCDFNNENNQFNESNYNMEGYIMPHNNENSNLKIHSPEGFNYQQVQKELNEDANRNNQLRSVTGRGPGYWGGCKNSPHIKSWILCIILWILILMKTICFAFESSLCKKEYSYSGFDDSKSWEWKCSGLCSFTNENDGTAFWIVLAVVAILYLVETGCSSSRRYLSNTFEKDGMVNYVGRIQSENRPRIWWKVVCYHYETRYRTVTKTDSNGNKRTERESYTEKVITWTAHDYYRYRICNDISGTFSYGTKDKNDPNILIEHLILQLCLYKTFSFANWQTQSDYNYKAMLFRWYNDRDIYQDFHYGMEIDGFKPNMLGELEPGNKPECMTLGWYWIISLLGFSPCYRLWFSSKCHKKTFLINKQISI